MDKTRFAYADASVRAAEHGLLTEAFMEQLIAAPTEQAAAQLLTDKGFDLQNGLTAALDGHRTAGWAFLQEIAPEGADLRFLIVRNDYHNLKAVLKAAVAGADARDYFLLPAPTDPERLLSAMKDKDVSELRPALGAALLRGYELITATLDGQLLDLYLDREALRELRDMTAATGSAMLINYVEQFVAQTDLRIALRLAKGQKSDTVLNEAFCPCDTLDTGALRRAVGKGQDAVLELAAATELSPLCAAYRVNAASFEKACDDRLLRLLDGARLVSFGIEPLAAYYCAREAEIRMLRIIMGGRSVGLTAERIKERMRQLYG